MRYTISEDVEVILDGQRFLLETGDIIVVEAAYVDLERTYSEIAELIADNFDISDDDIELIKDGRFGEIGSFDSIKKFTRKYVKQNPDVRFRVTDNVMGDILSRLADRRAPTDDWKEMPAPSSSGRKAFAGEKEKLDKQRAAARERLQAIFNPE